MPVVGPGSGRTRMRRSGLFMPAQGPCVRPDPDAAERDRAGSVGFQGNEQNVRSRFSVFSGREPLAAQKVTVPVKNAIIFARNWV